MRWITAHYFHASNLDPTKETEEREREREKGGKNQKKKQHKLFALEFSSGFSSQGASELSSDNSKLSTW
jgi:hypothetical protein